MPAADDEAPPPLFIRDEPGPTFTIRDAARAIARTGDDGAVMYNRYKGLAQRGLVHRASKGAGATSAARYHVSDVAVAAILSALFDIGLGGDASATEAASTCLYTWPADDYARPARALPRPILAALRGTDQGEGWVFRMDLFRSDQTGAARRVVRVYDTQQEPKILHLSKDMLPVGSVFLHLRPLLLPLVRLLHPQRGH